jgi:hypothetical protein
MIATLARPSDNRVEEICQISKKLFDVEGNRAQLSWDS